MGSRSLHSQGHCRSSRPLEGYSETRSTASIGERLSLLSDKSQHKLNHNHLQWGEVGNTPYIENP